MMRRQRGSTLVVTVVSWSMFIICLGIAVDLGRLFVFREQLRTAADAAALAGAMQVTRMVRVYMPRDVWEQKTCPDPAGVLPEVDCSGFVPASPVDVDGPEVPLWSQHTYQSQCNWPYVCDYSVRVVSCWLEPKGNDWSRPGTVAQQVFDRNAVWGSEARKRAPVSVRYTTDSTYRDFTVDVEASLVFDTLLMGGFGIPTVEVFLPPDQRPAHAIQLPSRGYPRPPCQ